MGVTATPAALEAIARLRGRARAGRLLPVGGLLRRQLPDLPRGRGAPARRADLLLGHIGGAPFYIDADQYERWRRPDFVVDLSPGPAEGFSLGLADQHFVTKDP